jgi:hypothetical protein
MHSTMSVDSPTSNKVKLERSRSFSSRYEVKLYLGEVENPPIKMKLSAAQQTYLIRGYIQ